MSDSLSPSEKSLLAENAWLRLQLEKERTANQIDHQTDDELRLITQRFELALVGSNVTVFSQDLELRYTWCYNPACGFDETAVIGKRDADLIERAEDLAAIEAIKYEVIMTGENRRREVLMFICGVPFYYDLVVEPLRNATGIITGVACAAVDITERKNTEAALLENRARLSHAADVARMTYLDIDFLNSNVRFAKNFTTVMGYSPPNPKLESVDLRDAWQVWIDHMAPEDRAIHARTYQEFINGSESEKFDYRVIGDDGITRWMESVPTSEHGPDGSLRRTFIINIDITTRKQAEAALKQNAALFATQIERAPMGVYVVDADFRIRLVNPQAAPAFDGICPLLGRDFDEILAILWPPEIASRCSAIFRHTLESGERYISPSFVEQRIDLGQVEAYEWEIQRVTLPDGEFGVVCYFKDVTERDRAEEAIRLLNMGLESRVEERTFELQSAVSALQAEFNERQRLEREILEISEREQCRLGQDLHDGLGQELAGVSLLSKVLADKLSAESHPCSQAAADIAKYSSSTIESARRLAKGLYPVELSRNGLLLALEDLAGQTSQRFGISCQISRSIETPKLHPSAEIHIYRIIQESIANAIKHGKATSVFVECLADAESYIFTVTDNGVGFANDSASAGMGLHLMDYRARVIGAQLDVVKPPQGGCRVTCRLSAD